MPLNQVATVSAGDAHCLLIAPFDRQNIPAIEKAVRESDLGLNPAAEAGRIRVAMPPLSEERRRELAKVVKREAETARVAVRNIRRDAVAAAREQVKKSELSEDEGRRLETRAQEITDRRVKQIDEMAADKEAELLKV
jgi:ribosome recycling factor